MIADAEAKGLIKAGEVSVQFFLILMSEIGFVNPCGAFVRDLRISLCKAFLCPIMSYDIAIHHQLDFDINRSFNFY